MAVVDSAADADVVDVVALAEEMTAELADVDHLRAVGYYSPADSDTVHLRDDVRRQVPNQAFAEPLEDAVLESLATATLEDYFDDELAGTMRVFGNKVVVYCRAAELCGVVVVLDRDTDLGCRDVLRTFERVADPC